MPEPTIKPVDTETQKTERGAARVISIDVSQGFKREPVSIDDVYYSPELIGSPQLRNALSLLASALNQVDAALELLAEQAQIGADDAMQHFQVLLPELFACRKVGEGLGLVVSSLQNAISRLRGRAMDEPQIRVVRSCLVALRSEPFMTFDAAMDLVKRLERAGLNVDPPNFEILADLLSE